MSDPTDPLLDRELPELVRARVRDRVLDELDRGRRPSRWFVPVAVATFLALVAVVGGSAVLVHQGPGSAVLPGSGDGQSDPAAGQNRWLTPDEQYAVQVGSAPPDLVARCAARRPGHTATWQPMLTASLKDVTVIAFRTSAGPVFCQTTPATVAVSAPGGLGVTGNARATFVSALGTVAGVVDPRFTTVSVGPGGGAQDLAMAAVGAGVFIAPIGLPRGSHGLTFSLGGTPLVQGGARSVPAGDVPAVAAAVTDHPMPQGDQTSPDGKRLAECFARTPQPTVDAADWQPTQSEVLDSTETIQLGRYDGLVAVCVLDTDPGDPSVSLKIDDATEGNGFRDLEAAVNPWLFTTTVFYAFGPYAGGGTASDTVAVTGLTTSAAVASVSISRPISPTIHATVHNGTFVLPGINLDEGTLDQQHASVLTVYDAKGAVLATVRIPL